MNLSRIILLLIVLTSSSLSSQTKQDLENQKKQIQQDIKKMCISGNTAAATEKFQTLQRYAKNLKV